MNLIKENNELYLLSDKGERLSLKQWLLSFGEKRVFAFDGKMGAGKTTFIRQLCEELGVQDVVNSPTFAIVNVYKDAFGEDIYHFDCYRLKNPYEAIDFGAEEYLYSGCYCFIEWPDIISDLLPDDTVWISISVDEQGKRELTVGD